MVIQAHLKIRHAGCVSEKVVDGARVIHMSGDERHCLSVFRATSEEQLARLIAGNHHVLEPGGVVDRASNWAVVRCRCPLEGSRILPLIREFGCSLLWPAVEAEGHEFYTVLAPSRGRVKELARRLEAEGEVTVERVRSVPGQALDVALPLSDVTQNLTQRQLEALRSAVESGYYDSPRRTHVEALAAGMGTSRSTYQEHLQKAEAVVMKSFVSLVLDHPALDGLAAKGRGRPRSETNGSK